MILLFRCSTRASVGLLLLVILACSQAEDHLPPEPDPVSTEKPASLVERSPYRNPFTRISSDGPSDSCLNIAVKRTGDVPEALVTNKCDYDVAVLTSPLEVRIRHSATEKLVHERMSWAVYAILYVASAELGKEAFRGDGIIRDGGLSVRRPPDYSVVGGEASITIPLRCEFDVPPGRYYLLLSTFEAPLLDAPSRSDPFDCTQSVDRWNEDKSKGSASHISLSPGASRVPSASPILELAGERTPRNP